MNHNTLPAPPRKRGRPRKGTEPLANVDHASILQRYLKDEKASSIAASLGVHLSALHQFLLTHHEEEWKTAQVARSLTQWEMAKEALGKAHDQLSLARAREELKSAQWDLERLLTRIFGQKPVAVQVNVEHQTVVSAGEIAGLVAESVARLRHAAVLPAIEPGTDIAEDE